MGCKKHLGWRGMLKNCGCKMTKPREIILEYLSNNCKHLTVEDIYFALKNKSQDIGLTTVYRTLELMVQNGILNKFDIGDGKSRYELAFDTDSKDHHHHLICCKCGIIINYTDFIDEEIQLLKKIEKELSSKYKFKILNHIIQFQGVCENCSIKMVRK